MSNSNTSFGFSIPQDQIADRFIGLPDGDYPFQLIAAERKASPKNPGDWYIEAKYKVLAGPLADRTHTQRYMVGYIKETTKNNALADVKRLAIAVGYPGPIGDFDPYFGKAFCGTIRNTKSQPNEQGKSYDNCDISGYKPISAYVAGGTSAASPPTITGNFGTPVTIAPLIVATPAANEPRGPAPWATQAAAA